MVKSNLALSHESSHSPPFPTAWEVLALEEAGGGLESKISWFLLQKAKPTGDCRGFADLEEEKGSGARDTQKDLDRVWTGRSASQGQGTKQECLVVTASTNCSR